MWRWAYRENSTAQALPLLASLTGTPGERFVWNLSGTRAGSNPKTYVVRFPPSDVVIVADNNPLSVGMDGAVLILEKFRLLKGDYDIVFEGVEFKIGENMFARIGQMKRKQNVLSEFCEIRWSASASEKVTGAARELLAKLSLPTDLVEVIANFSSIPVTTPFCSRHLALQLVKMHEDVIYLKDTV